MSEPSQQNPKYKVSKDIHRDNAARNDKTFLTNHLFFIDDLKLIAKQEVTLEAMIKQAADFFTKINMRINDRKSSVNYKSSLISNTIDEADNYKYLGILEGYNSTCIAMNKEVIKDKACDRIDRLLGMRLSGVNVTRMINTYALSVFNYYIGVIDYEEAELEVLDKEIRQILVRNRYHSLEANKQRLYLPRDECGRGITSLVHKAERIICKLVTNMTEKAPRLESACMIMETLNLLNNRAANIRKFCEEKYQGLREIKGWATKELIAHQHRSLYNQIALKVLHKKFFQLLR